MITAIHGDCMDYLKYYPDNYFELAICDPPYGIGEKFKGGSSGSVNFNEIIQKGWDDKKPDDEYFKELFRVSKNKIIWGGNYFLDILDPTRCFIIWDKCISEDMSLSMCEFAWTSFDSRAKIWKHFQKRGDSIHPTQKPVKLYEWLLMNYAKQGDKILDTHGGSFSHAIACHNLGFDLTIFEIDEDYFKAGTKRLEQHQQQLTMF